MAGCSLVDTVADALIAWFDGHARDLPWRHATAGPWGVLVSEIMLQQTPVSRVEPIWYAWLARWPTPAAVLVAVAELLPEDPSGAARAGAAFMELGALVCTARAPRCPECPLSASCAWRLAGQPPPDGPTRRPQRYAGTDRQVRGLLLAVLRDATEPVPGARLDLVWPEAVQRSRALASLVEDGLVSALDGHRYTLVGDPVGDHRAERSCSGG